MALIKVEYDTVTKEAYATIDGKTVDNLSNLYCAHNYTNDEGKPQFYFEICSQEYDKENKMYKTNRVAASLRKPDAKETLYNSIAHRVFPSA